MSPSGTPAPDLTAAGRRTFGFDLRPPQLDALSSILDGRDTLAVLPTGSGKSAIYQLAGLLVGGTTIVVSPLVALQRDQVAALRRRRHPTEDRPIRVDLVNATLSGQQRAAVLNELHAGRLDVVALSPEQLVNPDTRAALLSGEVDVRLVAVDEAHLVSEWGHDFRPAYVSLAALVRRLARATRPVVLALTATASPPVQADITRTLAMSRPRVVVADFDRPNIELFVRRTARQLPEKQAIAQGVIDVVGEAPAIVYAMSHNVCIDLANQLAEQGWSTAPYHSGLSRAHRDEAQDRFASGSLDIVVATSAFGMGIDKHDVRTVAHAGVPADLDEYYQEIGRAGRDGRPATAVLVHDERALRVPRLLTARSRVPRAAVEAVVEAIRAETPPPARAESLRNGRADQQTVRPVGAAAIRARSGLPDRTVRRVLLDLDAAGLVAIEDGDRVWVPRTLPRDVPALIGVAADRRRTATRSKLDAMRHYAETLGCRRAELLAYFGEHYPAPCGRCDNCHRQGAAPAPVAEHPMGGQQVTHRLWGVGTLLAQDEHELVVFFESAGYRHLTHRSVADGVLTLLP